MSGAVFLFPLGSVGSTARERSRGRLRQVVHNAPITEKYTTRSKNRTNYHVRVASWRNPGETESFQISGSEYNAVVPNQSQMVITTRAGAFGIEWLVSKRVNVRPGKK